MTPISVIKPDPASSRILFHASRKFLFGILMLPALVVAQGQTKPENDGFPKKTGVLEPGIQHPMTDLSPEAEFPVEGHPDWFAITGDERESRRPPRRKNQQARRDHYSPKAVLRTSHRLRQSLDSKLRLA
jgi:hypothetical protein